jgi:glycosyltransferase involved in cell wall biosynthesis
VGVLVLTTVLPGGRRGGAEIVTQGLIGALSRAGREPAVVGYRRPAEGSHERSGETCVGEREIETSSAGVRAVGWMARAILERAPYSVTKYRSSAYLRGASAGIAARPEAVILDSSRLYFAVRDRRELAAPLILVAHNAEARLYERLAAAARGRAGRWVNGREARLVRAVEAKLAARARQVWTLTSDDAEYFRSLVPGADVRTLEVASLITAPTEAAPAYDIALIGSWSWRANAEGLRWFSREVVPRLPSATSVEVAGAGADWLRGRHPNVIVRGVVPDAERFMSRARVIAVPSTTGGGVQVKTLDAIATGVPVVATGVAVRGLRDLPGSVVVSDDAAEFAHLLEHMKLEGSRADLRAEAVGWSRARQERFDAMIAAWIAEVVGDHAAGSRATLPAT